MDRRAQDERHTVTEILTNSWVEAGMATLFTLVGHFMVHLW